MWGKHSSHSHLPPPLSPLPFPPPPHIGRQSLVTCPRVLLLDEPSSGLDAYANHHSSTAHITLHPHTLTLHPHPLTLTPSHPLTHSLLTPSSPFPIHRTHTLPHPAPHTQVHRIHPRHSPLHPRDTHTPIGRRLAPSTILTIIRRVPLPPPPRQRQGPVPRASPRSGACARTYGRATQP